MATLNFAGTDRKVFTPIPGSTTTGIAGLSNAVGTLITLVQMTLVGNADMFGLTDAATANWYHDLQWAGGLNDTLFDDDGVVGTSSGSMTAQDTTNWFWLALDWPSTAAAPSFHMRNHSTGGAWSHATGGAGPAARNGPGTGGWLRIGAAGDHSAGSRNIGVAAVWAGTRFTNSDYGTWTKTSDLYNHALGHPSFLCEVTATTLVDLIGASTYSSGNSSGTTLTGGDPPTWTFDGLGSTTVPVLGQAFNPIPFMGGH